MNKNILELFTIFTIISSDYYSGVQVRFRAEIEGLARIQRKTIVTKRIDITDSTREKLDLSRLKSILPFFRPHVRTLVNCALLMGAGAILSITSPLILRHAIDKVFPSGRFQSLLLVSVILFSIIVLSFLVNYLQQIKLQIVGQKIVKKIRIQVFSHMTRLPQAYFSDHPVGTILVPYRERYGSFAKHVYQYGHYTGLG